MTLSLRKFISSLHSISIDQAVMLILVMKTQQQQANTSNFSGNQLLSSAVLEIKCPSGKVIAGQSEDTATKAPVQNSWQKKHSSLYVNDSIQTFHFQLVLNGECRTTRSVI